MANILPVPVRMPLLYVTVPVRMPLLYVTQAVGMMQNLVPT